VISATPLSLSLSLSQAFASEADPLLGAWRCRNETGKVVSLVLASPVAGLLPLQPGYLSRKRITIWICELFWIDFNRRQASFFKDFLFERGVKKADVLCHMKP
jgi:hypothetical protein